MSGLRTKWILLYAVLTHFLWGGLILAGYPAVGFITAVNETVNLFGSITVVGVIYVAVAAMSAFGMFAPARWLHPLLHLWLMLPQQAVLFLSAFGATRAMMRSAFADGVIRPRAFLIADQSGPVLLAVLHTLALMEYFAGAWVRRQTRRWIAQHFGSQSAPP